MRALLIVLVLLAGSAGLGWQLWRALLHGKVRNLDGREIVYWRDVLAFRAVVSLYAALVVALLYTVGLLTPEMIGEISTLAERVARTELHHSSRRPPTAGAIHPRGQAIAW